MELSIKDKFKQVFCIHDYVSTGTVRHLSRLFIVCECVKCDKIKFIETESE